MGELYCCSSSQRIRKFDDENKESIGKLNFTKKYIIGVGGFSKVSIFFNNYYYNICNFRFGKLNVNTIINIMQ